MGLLFKAAELIAGFFGINLTVAAAVIGVLGGGVVGGTGGYFIGDALGYNRGEATANKQAELNDALRKLDEIKRDKEASDNAASAAQADAASNRKLKEEADARATAYEATIKARRGDGSCEFSDDDLNVLQNNSWGPRNPR